MLCWRVPPKESPSAAVRSIIIQFMESADGWSVDLLKERHLVENADGVNVSLITYRYADPAFSILNSPLSEMEIDYLKSALEALGRFRGLPQLPWIQNALAGIRMFSLNRQENPCFEFEHNPYLGGGRCADVLDHLARLFDAIQAKAAVVVTYKAFDASERQFRLHPQYLKQDKHRWYVLSVTTERPDSIFTLAVDRILSVESCLDAYIDIHFDSENYFDDIIGITNVTGSIEDVHLHVFGWAAPYIFSGPLHGSQRSRWIEVDGQKVLDVHLSVKINQDLEGVLMSFADCITVISPASLVESHLQRIRDAAQRCGIENGELRMEN